MCQLQQSSMAGGGGSVISAEAFNFLEFWWKTFNIFLDTTFNGSMVQQMVVVLSAGYLRAICSGCH